MTTTTTRTRSTTTTSDGITWYYEQEGTGPDIVLIPDGLGECQMFDKPMALIASQGFRVTTFDMPGLSRSHQAPPEAYKNVTAQKLATQVNTLLEHLKLEHVTVWGCSSGALCVLGLCTYFPKRIRNACPHEAPLHLMDMLKDLPKLPDETISQTMAAISARTVGDEQAQQAWKDLGEEVHARLSKNYVTWAHGYISDLTFHLPIADEDLHKVPISWTVGGSSPMAMFFSNVVVATKAGLPIQVLPGGHFPYVTHPKEMSTYIVDVTRKYL